MSSPKFFKEPHTICIIQITRMGDIVQTIQAAECLKREYPDVKLIFIGRKTFASPLEDQVKLIFSKIFYIDLLHLFDSNQVKCLDDARGKLKGIINLLEKEKITVNINLSFSNSSSYLNTLIPAKFKIGIYKNNFDQ